MIRDFENTEVSSAFPPECKKPAELYGIKTVFFVKRTYSFASVADFQTMSNWIDAIKDGNIIPLFGCKDFIDNSDADPLEANGQDYLYIRHKGKYKLAHVFDYTYDYAKNVKGLSQTDFDYIFVDRNGHIVAYTPDGVEVRGFETDSITVLKGNIGTSSKSNQVMITVELSEADQFDLNAEVYKPDWSISQNLRLVPVSFSEMNLSGMTFVVKDSVFAKPVNHLMKSNFVLNEGGGITFNTFIKLGDGKYYLNDFSSPPSVGEVEIDSRIYYGSGVYGSATTATVNNFAFIATSFGGYFYVNLRDYLGVAIESKVLADFSLDAGTITNVTTYSDGDYLLRVEKGSITTGTIYFDDGNYDGSTAYDFTDYYVSDDFSELRQVSTKNYAYSQSGIYTDSSGSYLVESGAWRIITTVGADTDYVFWNRIVDSVNTRITINIQAISAGELKFVNGANSQAYTTPGIKTFDWTGDGTSLKMYTNTVNCLLSDFKIETF